eukprot:1160854-Pelagomonas_calceolata.AAC.11
MSSSLHHQPCQLHHVLLIVSAPPCPPHHVILTTSSTMITCGRSGEAAQFSSVLFALIGAAATVYTVLAHREYGSPAPSTIVLTTMLMLHAVVRRV